MKHRHLAISIAASLAMAGQLYAATFSDDVISQLTRQGFASITSETTWLGRVRITAQRDGGQREIVLNPRSGEILRDIWTPAAGSSAQVPIVDDVGGSGDASGGDGSSGSGSGGDGSGGNGSGGDGSGDGGGGSGGGGSGDDHGGDGKN